MTTSVLMPRKGDIKAVATSVGNHYRSATPCPSGNCAISNRWDDAVLMMGMIEHWRTHGTAAYKSYTENWARANSWELFDDLSKDQINPNWHNRMMAGYAYQRLLQAGSAGATVADVRRNLDDQLALQLAPEQEQLVDYIFPGKTKSSFSWKEVDANFMGLPIWVMMGRQSGKAAYYDRARELNNYQINTMGLRDQATKLWYRDESFKTRTSPSGKKIIWGRGTGWMAGGLAIVLSELPRSRPEYNSYKTQFTDLMAALRTRQRADGFWNMNITDPDHFPAPETSATALITYAMAKGIDLGILDRAAYAPVAAKAWNAMVATSVASNGYLGFVQGVGLQPVAPTHAGYPDEDLTAESSFGVGAFLLAASAMHKLSTAGGTTAVTRHQAESLATAVSPGDTQADFSNRFAHGGKANAAKLNGVGDFVQFTANVPDGTYDLRVKVRTASDQATWQLLSNGVALGPEVDGYEPSGHFSEVDFGTVALTGAASRTYRFLVTGKNTSSSGYNISVDSLSFYALAAGNASTLEVLRLAGSDLEALKGTLLGESGLRPAPVPLPPSGVLLLGGLCLALLRTRRRAGSAAT